VGQPGDCDSKTIVNILLRDGGVHRNESNVPAPTDGEIHWDENKHQAALFSWARREMEAGREELRVLGAISNGRGQIGGHTLRNYKELGHLVGMPDIYFLLPRGGFHGLFIELKTLERHSHLEQCQIDFAKVLIANGYDVRTCHGYRECILIINAYAALPSMAGRASGVPGDGGQCAESVLQEILSTPDVPLVSGPALLRARLGIDSATLHEQIRQSSKLTLGLDLLRARQEVFIFSAVSRGQMVDSTARFLTWKILGCPIDLSRPPAGEEGGEDFDGLMRAYGGED
jgi:hypothetical protein